MRIRKQAAYLFSSSLSSSPSFLQGEMADFTLYTEIIDLKCHNSSVLVHGFRFRPVFKFEKKDTVIGTRKAIYF